MPFLSSNCVVVNGRNATFGLSVIRQHSHLVMPETVCLKVLSKTFIYYFEEVLCKLSSSSVNDINVRCFFFS